jgi:hypothetical protein
MAFEETLTDHKESSQVVLVRLGLGGVGEDVNVLYFKEGNDRTVRKEEKSDR